MSFEDAAFEVGKAILGAGMPEPDQWHYVPSSNVTGFMYTQSQFTGGGNALFIKFKWGAEYEYDNVPDETIRGLDGASSPGSFVNSDIKNRFNYRRVL